MPHRQPRIGNARQRIWNALRVYKRFTAAEIAPVAEATQDNVQKYLRALARSGYLRLERAKRNGCVDGHAVWKLLRNSGPRCPIVRTDQGSVYDPNSDEQYPCRPARPEEDDDGAMDERAA